MDTTWISSASSGVFNYLYNSITGEDESPGTNYRSQNTLCKGMWVTDLPTNNYEPLEVSHGARAKAKEYNREKELEEKISVLKAQCNAKSKEYVCLQDKVSEVQQNGEKKANDLAKKLEEKQQLMKKANKFVFVTKGKLLKKEGEVDELNKELLSIKDTFANLGKSNQSLSSQVAELKTVLAKREEIYKQQSQLIRALAEDAKNKLEKASANISKLTAELNVCKAENSELRRFNSVLEDQRENLQDQLKEASGDSMKITNELESSKERESQSQNMITSLKQRLSEAQERLQNMANKLQQKEQGNRTKDKLFQHVVMLKSQLRSNNSTLQEVIQAKSEMTVLLDSYKERENQSQNTITSLKEHLTEAHERLKNMADELQQKEQDNQRKEELSEQVSMLKSQLSSSNAALQDFVQANREMAVLLDSSKENERQYQVINLSLSECLNDTQKKLDEMVNQLQEREEVDQEKEIQLSCEIASLKSKLNSTNDALLRAETEMMATMDNSKEVSSGIIVDDTYDGKKRKSEVTAVLNNTKADCNNNLRTPPFICPTNDITSCRVRDDIPVPRRDPVQTQQTGGSSAIYVNPFSMRAVKSDKADCYSNLRPPPVASPRQRTKQLRPSSPFIPVSNLPAPVVTQTSMAHKNQKKNINASPFSGIENQGFFNGTLKWFGF